MNSPAEDLNSLIFFFCLDASVRMKVRLEAVKSYHEEVKRMHELGGVLLDFTLEDLLVEMKRKHVYAIVRLTGLYRHYILSRVHEPDVNDFFHEEDSLEQQQNDFKNYKDQYLDISSQGRGWGNVLFFFTKLSNDIPSDVFDM